MLVQKKKKKKILYAWFFYLFVFCLKCVCKWLDFWIFKDIVILKVVFFNFHCQIQGESFWSHEWLLMFPAFNMNYPGFLWVQNVLKYIFLNQ